MKSQVKSQVKSPNFYSGSLPPEWTVERLLSKHPSAPFNPDIANIFFRSGQIEAWGRGIERMLQTCLEAGQPRQCCKWSRSECG